MDFSLTPEQQAFRREVAAVLAEALPPGRFVDDSVEVEPQDALLAEFLKVLSTRRWLAISWPEEYGGGGRTIIDQAIFNEQMGYYRAPQEAMSAVTIIGPSILAFGTPEQKGRHLPRIARGEGVYWQLFTEPNAGSDLASLTTSARRDGDEFVLNGQKVYVGDGREPEWLYVAARTDPSAPKHKGISIFLVDASTPGVSYQRLEPVAGWMKNQVFFDDVRIPASALMGQPNDGWSHMRHTLSVERSGIFAAGICRRTVDDLIGVCRELKRDGCPLIEHEYVQNLLAELLIELEAWTLMCWRIVWLQATNRPTNAETSIVAVMRKDFWPRLGAAIIELTSSFALLRRNTYGAPIFGDLELWQRKSIHTHGGGTPEIQRNVIALRGLELPR